MQVESYNTQYNQKMRYLSKQRNQQTLIIFNAIINLHIRHTLLLDCNYQRQQTARFRFKGRAARQHFDRVFNMGISKFQIIFHPDLTFQYHV